MRKTVQLLLSASLCGCVAPAPDPGPGSQRVNPIPISLALEEIITSGIRPRLEDPASAKFGTMLAGERMLNGRREIVVCGSVSTRNASAEPFMSKIYPDDGSRFELVAMRDQSQNGRPVVGEACRAAGLPVLDSDSKSRL